MTRYNKISPDEQSIMVRIRMPESMKKWLDRQPNGLSEAVRKMVTRAMRRERSKLVL